MSAAQNLKDNWPTLVVAILGSIILPFLFFRFSYAVAQEKTINDRLDGKVDKTEYYERWGMHEEADSKEFQIIIKMLDGLDKKTDRIEDRMEEIKQR